MKQRRKAVLQVGRVHNQSLPLELERSYIVDNFCRERRNNFDIDRTLTAVSKYLVEKLELDSCARCIIVANYCVMCFIVLTKLHCMESSFVEVVSSEVDDERYVMQSAVVVVIDVLL